MRAWRWLVSTVILASLFFGAGVIVPQERAGAQYYRLSAYGQFPTTPTAGENVAFMLYVSTFDNQPAYYYRGDVRVDFEGQASTISFTGEQFPSKWVTLPVRRAPNGYIFVSADNAQSGNLSFSVTPGPTARIAIGTNVSTVAAGTSVDLQLKVYDQYDNERLLNYNELATSTSDGGNAAGISTVRFRTAGEQSATVRLKSNDAIQTTRTFSVTAGPAKKVIAHAGQSQTVLVNAALSSRFAARVTDDYGNPILGRSVIFSLYTADNNARGIFEGGNAQASVLTDAQGVATTPQVYANDAPGVFYAIAATAGVTGPQSNATFYVTAAGSVSGAATRTARATPSGPVQVAPAPPRR